MFLIVAYRTKNSSDVVDHKIIRAIDKDKDKIPDVVLYTEKEIVKNVSSEMKSKLPQSLQTRIEKRVQNIIYSYKSNVVKVALRYFGVNNIK